jgi:hypothetical protein
MPTKHHDDTEKIYQPDVDKDVISIEPAVLTSVRIKTIEKVILEPRFTPINVEKPVFFDKEYERPIVTDKEYERPVCVDKAYERPIVKTAEYEKPIIFEKEYERPVCVDKEYERPVSVEKEYTVPVPKEVLYDVPIVSMEKVKAIAEEAIETLTKAAEMLEEANKTVAELNGLIDKIKARIPEEIKLPKIKYEEITIKDIKIVPETVRVIGKIIAREG